MARRQCARSVRTEDSDSRKPRLFSYQQLKGSPTRRRPTSRWLKEYSPDMIRLNRRGVRETVRPSGHVINKSWDKIKTERGQFPATSSRKALLRTTC